MESVGKECKFLSDKTCPIERDIQKDDRQQKASGDLCITDSTFKNMFIYTPKKAVENSVC